MQPSAEKDADGNSKKRQDHILPVDVGRKLPVIVPENPECRELPHALGDIDVVEVVEDDKGEKSRGNDQHQDHEVQALKHIPYEVLGGAHLGDSEHRALLEEMLRNRVDQRFVRQLEEYRIILRFPAKGLDVIVRRHVNILIDVVLHDSRDRDIPRSEFILLQPDAVPWLHRKLAGEFFRNEHALVREDTRLPALPVPEGKQFHENLRILRNHQVDLLRYAGRGGVGLFGECRKCRGNLFHFTHVPDQPIDFLFLRVLRERRGSVIAPEVAELFVDDDIDRIPQPEADDQERHTGADPEDRHKQALFVTEKVPKR